jgi:hypothetical protein
MIKGLIDYHDYKASLPCISGKSFNQANHGSDKKITTMKGLIDYHDYKASLPCISGKSFNQANQGSDN